MASAERVYGNNIYNIYMARAPLQAVQLGATDMLWRHMLRRDSPPPEAAERQVALTTALCDLLARRGDDDLAAAAGRILFDARLEAWFKSVAAADASRPARVAPAACHLVFNSLTCLSSGHGVRLCRTPGLACALRVRWHAYITATRASLLRRWRIAGKGTGRGHAHARAVQGWPRYGRAESVPGR